MEDLNALFDSVEGLSEDLKEYGTMAAAAIGANMAWNFAVAKVGPSLGSLPAPVVKYGLPVATVLVGIYGGRKLARTNRRVGLGVTVGLVTAGVSSLIRQFVPGLPLPGALPGVAGYDGYGDLYGAPRTFEDYGSGVSGGPITVEETGVSGAPVSVEDYGVHGLAASFA